MDPNRSTEGAAEASLVGEALLTKQNDMVAAALNHVHLSADHDERLRWAKDPETQAARAEALATMMGLRDDDGDDPTMLHDYSTARARRSRDMVEALRGCQTLECVRTAHTRPPGPAKFNFPHFFIIGWQKTATTSLFAYLNRHPQVSRPRDKEPEFFSEECNYNIPEGCAHSKTLEYLNGLRMRRYTGYDGQLATYEASTHYSRNGHRMATALYELFPWLKIVVSLREPISRAASMLVHQVDKNLLSAGNQIGGCLAARNMDLGPCLLNESQISGDTWGGPAEYHMPLKAWSDAFPREQIFVVQYENLTSEVTEQLELKRLKEFLGIDVTLPSESVGLGLHNARKGKINPNGWPMKRELYEKIIEKVRPDCVAITRLITKNGWGDGKAWMSAWEAAWANNLASCDANGDCVIQLT